MLSLARARSLSYFPTIFFFALRKRKGRESFSLGNQRFSGYERRVRVRERARKEEEWKGAELALRRQKKKIVTLALAFFLSFSLFPSFFLYPPRSLFPQQKQ